MKTQLIDLTDIHSPSQGPTFTVSSWRVEVLAEGFALNRRLLSGSTLFGVEVEKLLLLGHVDGVAFRSQTCYDLRWY